MFSWCLPFVFWVILSLTPCSLSFQWSGCYLGGQSDACSIHTEALKICFKSKGSDSPCLFSCLDWKHNCPCTLTHPAVITVWQKKKKNHKVLTCPHVENANMSRSPEKGRTLQISNPPNPNREFSLIEFTENVWSNLKSSIQSETKQTGVGVCFNLNGPWGWKWHYSLPSGLKRRESAGPCGMRKADLKDFTSQTVQLSH